MKWNEEVGCPASWYSTDVGKYTAAAACLLAPFPFSSIYFVQSNLSPPLPSLSCYVRAMCSLLYIPSWCFSQSYGLIALG
jgi:hypothetical protein